MYENDRVTTHSMAFGIGRSMTLIIVNEYEAAAWLQKKTCYERGNEGRLMTGQQYLLIIFIL